MTDGTPHGPKEGLDSGSGGRPAGAGQVTAGADGGLIAPQREGDEFEYHSREVDLLGDPDDERWSIRCLDVHKRLGGAPVLSGLNVAIPDETITVVLGPSGTGKSVLIKHLIGLMFPDAGDVIVKGQSVPTLTLPKLLACAARSACCSRTAPCSGRCRCMTTSRFRCASTPTWLRRRSPQSSGSVSRTSV